MSKSNVQQNDCFAIVIAIALLAVLGHCVTTKNCTESYDIISQNDKEGHCSDSNVGLMKIVTC